MKSDEDRKTERIIRATEILIALAIVVTVIAAIILGRWLSGR